MFLCNGNTQCHVIYEQINALIQNNGTPDLPFDDSQPDSGDKRAAFERYMEQLDIPRMSQTVLETVRKIDALADTLEPLTSQTKREQLARLEELEAENTSLGRQLEVLTAQAGLLFFPLLLSYAMPITKLFSFGMTGI